MRGAVLGAILLVGLALRLYGITSPLTDSHHQRQTQTALIALDFYRHGIDLWNPRLPIFGAREQVVRLDFPLYQGTAALLSHLGGFSAVTGRLLSIVGALIAIVFVWRISLLLGASVLAAGVAAAVMAMSPLWIYFGRAYMSDVWAHTAALAALLGALESRVRCHPTLWLIISTAALSLALLMKITTIYVALPIVLVLGGGRRPLGWPARMAVAVAAIAPVSVWMATGTRSEISAGFAIAGVLRRNFSGWTGALSDPGAWKALTVSLVGLGATPLVVAAGVWGLVSLRGTVAFGVLSAWCGALAFTLAVLFPAATSHPYYQLGWVPLLAVAAGFGAASLAALAGTLQTRTRRAVAAVGVVVVTVVYVAGYGLFYSTMYDLRRLVPYHVTAGRAVEQLTTPEDVLAVDDPPNVLNTTFAYYADRRIAAFDTGRARAAERLMEVSQREGVTVLVAIDNAYGTGARRLRSDEAMMRWLGEHSRMLIDDQHLVAVRLQPQSPGPRVQAP